MNAVVVRDGPVRNIAQPSEIAKGVWLVPRGTGKSNVYLVRSGPSWTLIDAAWAHHGELIRKSAEMLFGVNAPPAAILLTHLHPDHAGSAAELARAWNVPVYVHQGELPLPSGKLAYSDPIDRVIGPFTRFLPEGEFEACLRLATAFDPAAGVPGLPGWQCVPTPGHTPGHVSYFRPGDRVLISGDAVLTVSARSLWACCPVTMRSPVRRASRPGTGRRPRSPLPSLPGWSRGYSRPATERP